MLHRLVDFLGRCLHILHRIALVSINMSVYCYLYCSENKFTFIIVVCFKNRIT